MAEKRGGRATQAAGRYGPPLSREMHLRLLIVAAAFIVVFGGIVVRLAWLHLSPRLELTDEDRRHIWRDRLSAPRGEIFDRNGLLLATDRDVPSIWADARRVKDPRKVARVLKERLGADEREVLEALSKTDRNGDPRKFVWLKRWLLDTTEEDLKALEEECGEGVSARYEPVRYYPHGETAAHLLGFVNRVGEASEGLELTYDARLRCEPGEYKARKDGAQQLLASLLLEYKEPVGGESIQLTLDTDLQHVLEQALDIRMEECNAPNAMGIVMDPRTGAILAMASRPAFDPNAYDTYAPELRKNRALLDMFEPGSSFKIVTASAALEHGLITPATLIDCENGAFNPYGHRIRDFHKLGVVPFAKCFEESSNIAIIKVGAMLGPDRLEQWMRRFGFGQTVCRDFLFESPGQLRPRSQWSGFSMGALPMGQEIAVTMPQLARAFSVIANGGFGIDPYLVERAVGRDGNETYRHAAPNSPRILSPSTVQTMRELCHQVVLHGTGKWANIPEYRVGGKTGTAQMARKDGRGYDPDRYMTIFAGFAPVSDPRIVAVIVVQEPMIRLHYGGYVCGPVFAKVVRDALVRMHVPQDPVVDESPASRSENKQSPLVRQQMASVDTPLEDADTVAGHVDTIAFEESLANLLEPLDGLELVALNPDRESGAPELPDLRGFSKRAALEKLDALGVSCDSRGAGWVNRQNPPPGTPLHEVTLCSLEFSSGKRTKGDETKSAL